MKIHLLIFLFVTLHVIFSYTINISLVYKDQYRIYIYIRKLDKKSKNIQKLILINVINFCIILVFFLNLKYTFTIFHNFITKLNFRFYFENSFIILEIKYYRSKVSNYLQLKKFQFKTIKLKWAYQPDKRENFG